MKRSSGLVDYSSSEDETTPSTLPPAKKNCPTLSTSFIGEQHKDNPALHQGRIRTTPHVEGQFIAHVYIPVTVDLGSKPHAFTQEVVPSLHSFWESEDTKEQISRRELHISLSRPIHIRAHQREALKTAVKRLASRQRSFDVSFAAFATLTNDEATRAFLALEVGAGHEDLVEITSALRSTLETLRQKVYYSNPRFHASFAWALLDGARAQQTLTPRDDSGDSETQVDFPTISGFPEDLLSSLKPLYSSTVPFPRDTTLFIRAVAIRIGGMFIATPYL
ncbi:hypothetical protein DL96DRAFT_1670223 [Flagelloscypha sp. PMI_526]|nr:hypothetical protein DL96DRAFT_1670223 [Flagelloscypha sp. PMI_526]